jgi:hypothetical protein
VVRGGEHTASTLAFERELSVVHTVVDAPQGFDNSVPQVWEATHPRFAYVRLQHPVGMPFRAAHRPDLPSIPEQPSIAAYRVVQEALSNVVKHAGATRCTVTLNAMSDEASVQLTATDDGRGFDPGARHRGIGLIGMRDGRTPLAAPSPSHRRLTRARRSPFGCLSRVRIEGRQGGSSASVAECLGMSAACGIGAPAVRCRERPRPSSVRMRGPHSLVACCANRGATRANARALRGINGPLPGAAFALPGPPSIYSTVPLRPCRFAALSISHGDRRMWGSLKLNTQPDAEGIGTLPAPSEIGAGQLQGGSDVDLVCLCPEA